MMTDAMKFGPEWLRNLSQDGCSQPAISSTPRYQLAEYRYGREEMLALFDRLVKAPDTLVAIPALYVEKTQSPLALLQMTDEETRMWNRGINSDALLRSTMKTPAGITGVPRGGRGGSVDRGRGRGRGSYHYSRGLSYEESGESGGMRPGPERGESGGTSSAVSFPRNIRSYDRSQGPGSERSWGERNGADPGDWNGSTSPRKEYSGRGFMGDNWRRHRGGGEDDDGWRSSNSRSDKWGNSSYTGRPSSWRESDKDGPEPDRGGRNQGWDRGRGWDDTAAPATHHPHRRPWDDDNLPEWAMENPSESGGSFDASGAFHGGGLSEEDDVDGVNASGNRSREPRARLLSEGNSGRKPQPGRRMVGLSRDTGLSRSTEEEPHRSEDSGADRLVPGAAPAPAKSSPIPSSKKTPPPNVTDIGKHTTSSVNSKSAEDVLKSSPVLTNTRSTVNHHVESVTSRKQSVSNHLNSRVRKGSPESVPVPASSAMNTSNGVDSRYPAASEKVTDSVQKHQQTSRSVGRQKSEDDMERMQEVADDLVAKLMDDEEGHDKTMPSVDGLTGVASQQSSDKWFYRDPQGEVQGPFLAAEMYEWFRSGYFQLSLLVRRNCDDLYCELGELMKTWGRIPFLPGPSLPPLKAADPVSTRASVAPPSLNQSLPNNLTQDNLLMQQYQYFIQHQFQLRQAAAMQAAVGKLSQSEHWNSLPPGEQQRLLVQQLAQQPLDPPLNQFAPPKNPVMQLISQMQQQGKVPPSVVPESKISPTAIPSPPLDPLQQFIRDMGGLQPTVPPAPLGMTAPPAAATTLGMPNLLHTTAADKSDPDPIQNLLRQMGTKAVKPQQVDSVWGSTVPAAFSAPSWLQQMAPVPPAPPGQLAAASLWALHGKDIKTEQQILEEQQRRAEDERRREEQRKQQEEAEKKQKELEEEKRKQEAEKKRLEEHIKRLEEERKRQEEELKRRKAEEERQKKAAEEERKRQEEAKRLEEEQRKKEEAAKRREEEKKRKEEEKERKRKLEEERKREEEEKKRLEEEQARKKQEEEEQARRVEQQRRQAEALRRLQEQQQRAKTAPWSQQPTIPATGGSLIDIQRQEKEKKERETREREQQQALLQLQQQKQQQEQAAAAELNSKNIQLKWAEKKTATSAKVKSLSEIQAEEQEQVAKQQERERSERAQQQKDVALPPTASIWGTATQSLNWSSGTTNTNSTPAWGGAGTGNGTYWEEVAPPVLKPVPKNAAKSKGPAPAVTASGKGGGKARSKKEEAFVLKLFEHNTQHGDEFYQWCARALEVLQAQVDIPTFVGFLRDIESPDDVKEYVRIYLGDGKDPQDFARQFLERRSKWRSGQRIVRQEEDVCNPAPAANSLNTDFQEVKGKGKKIKKNKMFRVDNRILGFSVTAAQDRLNVGDRDYGEGV